MKNQEKTDKPPKRARKAIKHLHEIVDLLDYYMGESDYFKKHVVSLAEEIEDALHELSIDKNIDHIRLAVKLKQRWKIEQEAREAGDRDD
jgi:hypothetical protein